MHELYLERVSSPELGRVTASFASGLHAAVGGPLLGENLARLLSGSRSPSAGSVRLDGLRPHTTPGLRKRIASLYVNEPALSAGALRGHLRRVEDLRELAAGQLTASLQAWGHGDWAARPADSLGPVERRTLALVIALTLREPSLLVLCDPFGAGLRPERVASDLRERATAGAIVVVLAAERPPWLPLTTKLWLLEHRRLVAFGDATEPRARLRVRAEQATTLLAELCDGAAVENASLANATELTITGGNVPALARQVAEAAHRRGLALGGISCEIGSDPELSPRHDLSGSTPSSRAQAGLPGSPGSVL